MKNTAVKLKTMTTAAVLAMGVLSTPSLAGVDMFLKIEGVEGESQDEKHKGEIDVLSWSWGTSQSGSSGRSSGACLQDMSLVKWIDSASGELIVGSTIGQTYNRATLTMRSTSGDKTALEFLVITMHDVSVSSFQTGAEGGQDRMTESVSLNFDYAEWQYTRQDPRTGGGSGSQSKTIEGSSGRCR